MSEVLPGGGLIVPERYFFDQDESSHWYMIPVRLREEWKRWEYLCERYYSECEMMDSEVNEMEVLDSIFDKCRLSGGINYITFENPKEEE